MRKATARRNIHLGHPGGFTACGKAPGNFVFRPDYANTPPASRCRRCEADLASRRAYAARRAEPEIVPENMPQMNFGFS